MGKASMTRAHFQLIADTIKELDVDELARVRIATQFANALRRTNRNFDRGRFVTACGVTG